MSTELPTLYQSVIHLDKYSRWDYEKQRRETWEETATRYLDFMADRANNLAPNVFDEVYESIHNAILDLDVVGSMRATMTAGPALERDEVSGYNCSAIAVDSIRSFDEAMYLSMCGVGVGFSVENQYISKLPEVPELYEVDDVIVVADSKIGWASSFRRLLGLLYSGAIPKWDLSKLRPEGTPLKTFGGRSSGPGPLDELFLYVINTFKSAQGRKLNSIECHGIMCKIADIVVSGGVRRSAMISLSDPSDVNMRDAKSGQWWIENPHYALANNSAVWNEKPTIEHFLDEWTSLIKSKSGERGIINRKALKNKAIKSQRRDSNYDFLTNPCVTGDTLVAVADGRGIVSFSDLVKEGKDVLVFTYDDEGSITTRMMRNPRITGYDLDLVKVTLDDGSSIRCTPNHKFLLKNGEYVEAKNLKENDSLALMTRYASSMKKWNYGASEQPYWWINSNGVNQAEHRVIASNLIGRILEKDEIVHHKNYDGLDNSHSNLEVMTKKDHDLLHAKDKFGENNPVHRIVDRDAWLRALSAANTGTLNTKYSGYTHDDLREHGIALAQKLGRRFTAKEWQEYAKPLNLPQQFSEWRKQELGEVSVFAQASAIAANVPDFAVIGERGGNRILSALDKWILQGYDAFQDENGKIFVKKNCEQCDEIFTVPTDRREASICRECSISFHHERRMKSAKIAFDKKREALAEKQLEVFLDVKPKYKKEWVVACKERDISFEICRKGSPFKSWNDLKEAASLYNHRVVSVEPCGQENVYNGTVDDFHNFFVGGFETQTRSGKPKFAFINNRNCGEVILRPRGLCNLSEVIVRPEDSIDDLRRKVIYATILGTVQSTLTNFRYLSSAWKKNAEEERLLGVSLTGVMNHPILSQVSEQTETLLRELRDLVIETNKDWAEKLGINQSVSTTVNKPSGTVSQLALTHASGLHVAHSKFYKRTLRMNKTSPIAQFLYMQGVPCEDEITHPDKTWVFTWPMKAPDGAITRHDQSAIDQLKIWLMYSENWCEHNPSVTITVKNDEWLEVGDFVYKHWDMVGGISFLPYSDHTYQQAPFEDITESEYEELLKEIPESLDWSQLVEYEDLTEGAQNLACQGFSCEVA